MRILVTGACGFVGSTLIRTWVERGHAVTLIGVDHLGRPGSETNRHALRGLGVNFIHGDVRASSDVDAWPTVDWVIEAAANPSVLSGVDQKTSSKQLIEHNLIGTLNVLEYCRARKAGFVLLSTSRVYSIPALASLPVHVRDNKYELAPGENGPSVSPAGLTEAFPTSAPISLYGATKLASEQLALEYGETFGFPVWINRCGVLAGAGQFGRADQGIFSFWIHSWIHGRPLGYIGFGGQGYQVRDCLHPRDLVSLLDLQLASPASDRPRIQNVSGGRDSACSLRQCSDWCAERYGTRPVTSVSEGRRFDVPWLVLDSGLAHTNWKWSPSTSRSEIFSEIAAHAERHPDWLEVSAP